MHLYYIAVSVTYGVKYKQSYASILFIHATSNMCCIQHLEATVYWLIIYMDICNVGYLKFTTLYTVAFSSVKTSFSLIFIRYLLTNEILCNILNTLHRDSIFFKTEVIYVSCPLIGQKLWAVLATDSTKFLINNPWVQSFETFLFNWSSSVIQNSVQIRIF